MTSLGGDVIILAAIGRKAKTVEYHALKPCWASRVSCDTTMDLSMNFTAGHIGDRALIAALASLLLCLHGGNDDGVLPYCWNVYLSEGEIEELDQEDETISTKTAKVENDEPVTSRGC